MSCDFQMYTEKIKEAAIETLFDCKGRKIYKIPHNSAYILVRLYSNINYCEYQRHDEHSFTVPVTWSVSIPQEFYIQFLLETNHTVQPVAIVSFNELKSLNPIKFYNKNGRVYYKDCYGYFYYVEKSDLPNKKKREEYENFKDNKDAIKAKLCITDYKYKLQWFSSEGELIKEMSKNTSLSCSKSFYQILKRGYTKKPPEDRKVIFRLPYFQLDNEIEYEKYKYGDSKAVSFWVARKWCGMLEGNKQFGEAFQNIGWVEELITEWCKYTIKAFRN